MFKHFIGNVYLFNKPAQEELPLVDIPIFSQNESNTEESLLIQLNKDDMTIESWKRVQKYHNQSILSIDTLRSNSGINPDYQIDLAIFLFNNRDILESLSWSSNPSYLELKTLCCLIWEYFIRLGRYYDVSSGKQLAFKLNQLKHNQLKDIILNEIDQGLEADDAIENTLSFVRQWAQFHFPRFAIAVSRIQNELAEKLGIEKADYSFFCTQVENLFKDPALIALDEYGLPLPLAEKIENKLNPEGKLDIAIDNLSKLNLDLLDNLTVFEKELLQDVKDYI